MIKKSIVFQAVVVFCLSFVCSNFICLGQTQSVEVTSTKLNSVETSVAIPSESAGQKVNMCSSYVETVAEMAYIWGWPMVNLHNRHEVFKQVPAQGYLGGVMPVAPVNKLTMFPQYATPGQKDVAHPNQDVIYGFGLANLSETPVIIQVPDFEGRFWMYQLADQRTDSFGGLGTVYGTEPGFYMIVSPNWKGEKPEGVNEIFVSPTDICVVIPRIFAENNKKDMRKVQQYINRVAIYPLDEFTGEFKVTDWKSLPIFPEQEKTDKEKGWVSPENFFDIFPQVLDEVQPLPGEEGLYSMFRSLLEQTRGNEYYENIMKETARRVERELVDSLFYFPNVGVEINNYWTRPFNNGAFGTDYLTRLAIAKSNIFTNRYNEAAYFYQYRDGNGKRLNGSKNNYTITFTKDELPPVDGFWSITMYDEHHFFYKNEWKVYSQGTKNRNLKYNEDGSLTLYLQHEKPTRKKMDNWLPTPDGKFVVTIRAYAPKESIINGQWNPPAILPTKP